MYYTLIDPPVTSFSPPEKISEWIERLRSWSSEPEFQHPENRKRLEFAVAEAQGWLAEASTYAAGRRRQPPDRPAV
jgi:hypothetical protein